MILARKLARHPNIFMIFARKINKIPEFYMIFARKIARIFHNNCPKNIFPFFWGGRGGRAPCPSVSYAFD